VKIALCKEKVLLFEVKAFPNAPQPAIAMQLILSRGSQSEVVLQARGDVVKKACKIIAQSMPWKLL
jgi:hypothetical protein